MENFIGLPLSQVVQQLEKTNTPYEVVQNNFIIVGDTKLVTNVKSQNGKVVLTVGEFIFNLKKD